MAFGDRAPKQTVNAVEIRENFRRRPRRRVDIGDYEYREIEWDEKYEKEIRRWRTAPWHRDLLED